MGLMGVDNDGQTLYWPNGERIGEVPTWAAWRIQAAQHFVATLTWRLGLH